MEKKPKCDWCMFRARYRTYRCNYAYLTGHTRQAEPPEQCTHFRAGKRIETPEEAKAMLDRQERKAVRKVRPKTDWKKGLELYHQGLSDREIAKALNVAASTICGWRKRNGLPPNAGPYGKPMKQSKKEKET